ncbi:hypothetical protein PGT21_024147 [Puccinia graminis f. sp. tritici]|uniref:Uncharacterized protein n=1 Tax=Puccinia graminis f. sp. tritici TaxID=56615 RepID=A0A5B0PHG8_PUCGR|nr:hypothetical protein PGT21_024147 [Puccinia graminis f. sp. tritici]
MKHLEADDAMINAEGIRSLSAAEELIEVKLEQEQKDKDARKAQQEQEQIQKAEIEQQEKMKNVIETAAKLLPIENSVDPDAIRITSEHLDELREALLILSGKLSILKEKTKLKQLAEENQEASEDLSVPFGFFLSLNDV